jgi:hypothetical protein
MLVIDEHFLWSILSIMLRCGSDTPNEKNLVMAMAFAQFCEISCQQNHCSCWGCMKHIVINNWHMKKMPKKQ